MTSPFQPPRPHDSKDRLRLIAAVTLSLAILFGYNQFVEKPRQLEAQARLEQQTIEQQQQLDIRAAEGGAEIGAAAAALTPQTREEALTGGARLPIRGARVTGSLSLKGLRLDDLTLNEHREVLHGDDPVVLLAPGNTDYGFYFETGFVANGYAGPLPTAQTTWKLASGSASEITSGGAPVILEWNNGQGLTFIREITLDENYLFSVASRVRNAGGADVRLNAYQVVARNNVPRDFSGFFVLHEGPIAALNGEQEKISYSNMRDGDQIEKKDVSGWVGITDKYWLVAMLPDAKEKFTARMVGATRGAGNHVYQTDIVSQPLTVPAGGEAVTTTHLYAGVKNTGVIGDVEAKTGVSNLDFSLDFGMWYFITQPFYYLLHLLFTLTGSVAAGILLMTVIVRAAVFPLASKGFRSMARMKLIAPQLKELQTKYKDDKPALQMAIFELYKRENVNPFSGCWPLLVQIPIFFALYKVILLSVDLRHAPFWGWIDDLSAPDPTSIFNLFGLIPWEPPQMLMIGGWPLLFCLSMVVQKRLSPPMPDPVQEKIQGAFPFVFTVMLAHFASGLVIYWTWSNVLSVFQQYYILKKVGGEETSIIRGHAARRKKKE